MHDMRRNFNQRLQHEPALMQMRLERLTESGDIVESNGRYFIGRKRFIAIAKVIFALKAFILGKGSEFE